LVKSVRTITSVEEEDLKPNSKARLYAYSAVAISKVCGLSPGTVLRDQHAGKVNLGSLRSVILYIAHHNPAFIIS
jgi:hypothetical protein